MNGSTVLILVALLTAAVLMVLGGLWLLPRLQKRRLRKAIEQFRLQRERLEARFYDLARQRGKPRGVRWLECDWQSDVTFARDRRTGLLTAFAAVNIRFEAIEGGDMEDVEAVGLLRDAAAVFHFRRGRWGTGGRSLFNMNPHDAIERLQEQYEPLGLPAGEQGSLSQ